MIQHLKAFWKEYVIGALAIYSVHASFDPSVQPVGGMPPDPVIEQGVDCSVSLEPNELNGQYQYLYFGYGRNTRPQGYSDALWYNATQTPKTLFAECRKRISDHDDLLDVQNQATSTPDVQNP